VVIVPAFVLRLDTSMEHPLPNFHAQLGSRDEKAGLQEAGLIRSTT